MSLFGLYSSIAILGGITCRLESQPRTSVISEVFLIALRSGCANGSETKLSAITTFVPCVRSVQLTIIMLARN